MRGLTGFDQWSHSDPILDFELLVEKLLQSSSKLGLSYLHLEYIQYLEDLSVDFANALNSIINSLLSDFNNDYAPAYAVATTGTMAKVNET